MRHHSSWRRSFALAAAVATLPYSVSAQPGGRGRGGGGPQPIYSGTETALAAPRPASYIELVTASALVTQGGDIVLVPKCAAGRQLLGGGYFNGASAGYANVVSVRESYPLNDREWRVLFNSAIGAGWSKGEVDKLTGVSLIAYAYCLFAPGYDLDLTTTSADNTSLPTQAPLEAGGVQGVVQEWHTTCPPGSVLTGGGFQVAGNAFDTDANSNADVRLSMPLIGGDGIANGWRVGITAFPNRVRTTKAFARCARKGLQGLPAAVLSRDLTQSPTALGEHSLEAECAPNGITTAGGFEHRADWLTPRPLFVTGALQNYTSWGVRALGGYQTTSYQFRPCDRSTGNCLVGAVVASCFAQPDIPYINVRITSPPNKYHFEHDLKAPGKTPALVLTAEVYDRDGKLLPDAVVRWSYSSPQGSIPLAMGQRLVARLPAGQGIGSLYVFADASWTKRLKGTGRYTLTARDAIQLTTGTVP